MGLGGKKARENNWALRTKKGWTQSQKAQENYLEKNELDGILGKVLPVERPLDCKPGYSPLWFDACLMPSAEQSFACLKAKQTGTHEKLHFLHGNKRQLYGKSVSFKRKQPTFQFITSLSAKPWTLRTSSFPVPQERHPALQIAHRGAGASLLWGLNPVFGTATPKHYQKPHFTPSWCCAAAFLPQGFLHLPLVVLGQGCWTPQDKRSSAEPRYRFNINSSIVALHATIDAVLLGQVWFLLDT